MTTRVTTKTMIFVHPFVVNGMDGEQPPGVYAIETEEGLLESLWAPKYRNATLIYCDATTGVLRFVTIDPVLLSAALERDARILD